MCPLTLIAYPTVMGKSQIFRQKDLNLYTKSQIKSEITPTNNKPFSQKSQMKSNHDFDKIYSSDVLKIPRLMKAHNSQSQIIRLKNINHYAKSQIKSHEIKSNPSHLNPNHKSNQITMSTK